MSGHSLARGIGNDHVILIAIKLLPSGASAGIEAEADVVTGREIVSHEIKKRRMFDRQ